MSSGREHPEAPPSVHRSLGGTRIDYKRRPLALRTGTAGLQPPCPPSAPMPPSGRVVLLLRPTPHYRPRPSPSPTGTHRAARGSSQVGSTPEQSPSWPCSRCAAGRSAAGSPPPVRGHKSTIGELLHLLHIFPGQKPRRSRRIPASPPPPLVQGPNCEVWNLSRVLSLNRGHICEFLKSSRDPGAKHHLK
jgi:hypothetical protein